MFKSSKALTNPVKILRLSLAAVLAICAMLIVSAIWLKSPQDVILNQINDRLASRGYRLTVSDIDYLGNQVILHGVSISGNATATINKVTADVSIDPGKFGFKIEKLLVDGVVANFDSKTLQQLLVPKSDQKSASNKKLPPTSAPPINHIAGTNIQIKIALDHAPNHALKVDNLSFNGNLEGKTFSGKATAVAVSPLAKFQEITFGARYESSEWRYYVHNDIEAQQEYWSMEGKLQPNSMILDTITKFSGLPFFLPAKIAKMIPNPKSQLSALKVRINLADNNRIPYEIHYGLASVSLQHNVISSDIVGPASLYTMAKGYLDRKSDFIALESGVMRLRNPQAPKVAADATIAVQLVGGLSNLWHDTQTPKLQLALTLPKTNCQAIAQAIPKNLMPVLGSFKLAGTTNFDADLDIDLAKPQDFKLDYQGKFACVASTTDPRFRKPALLSEPLAILHGTLSPANHESLNRHPASDYSAYSDVSPYLFKALVAFEDGGFYQHHGLQLSSMIQALRTNLAAGKVTVGGSTITMQMVKNLFLTHDRNLSRKLQEVFLSWYIEKILTKNQIMEIYANIIEFGHNVFGITQAANDFFGKSPRELSVRESAYLASVLPSPVTRFKNYCKGFLSTGYKDFLNRRLRLMHSRGFLDDSELHDGLISELRFSKPDTKSECGSLAASAKGAFYQ